jgi:hypothetical protein
MYQDSLTEDRWYFFACAGLNITSKLIISLKSFGQGGQGKNLKSAATNSNAQMEAVDPLSLNQILADSFT